MLPLPVNGATPVADGKVARVLDVISAEEANPAVDPARLVAIATAGAVVNNGFKLYAKVDSEANVTDVNGS